jgi:hypothetical protein
MESDNLQLWKVRNDKKSPRPGAETKGLRFVAVQKSHGLRTPGNERMV